MSLLSNLETDLTSPKISIILPIRSRPRDLSLTVESICSQTFKDWELVALLDRDGGDNYDLLSRSVPGSQLKVIHVNYEELGFSRILNLGVQNAKYPLIARIDDDDIAVSDRLESQLRFFLEDHETVLVTGWAEVIDIAGTHKYDIRPSHNEAELLNQLMRVNVIPHSTVLVHRDQLIDVGGYRPDLKGCEDYDLWLRLVGRGRFHSVDRNMITYLSNPEGMTTQPIPRTAIRRLSQSRDSAMKKLEINLIKRRIISAHWRLEQLRASFKL